MAKSIKFKNDIYIDSTSVAHNKQALNEVLDTLSQSRYVIDTLLSDGFLLSPNTSVTKTLLANYTDYDVLVVIARSDWVNFKETIVLKGWAGYTHAISIFEKTNPTGYNTHAGFKFQNDNQIVITSGIAQGWSGIYIHAVYGIKY